MKKLVFMLLLTGCASTKIPDFEACVVELPYSKNGFCTTVVTKKEREIPKDVWVKERRTMVGIPADSYKLLKNSLYQQCFSSDCKQMLQSITDIFSALEAGVNAVDKAKK